MVGAWRRFKAQTAVPGVEAAAARDELDQVLSRVAADESRAEANPGHPRGRTNDACASMLPLEFVISVGAWSEIVLKLYVN